MPKEKEAVSAVKQAKQDTELESKLEKQSKDLWDIKDKLREHVSTAELRDMLTVNNQDATGSEYDLRERWLVHFMPITIIYSCPKASVSVLKWLARARFCLTLSL